MDVDSSGLPNVLGIERKTPFHPDWKLYSQTYNSRLPVEPKVVFLPANCRQVALTVSAASLFDYKVQARSGGFSYAPHSNGGVDGAVVIDLRKLKNIDFLESNVVRVGAGVRLGNLASTIYWEKGLALAQATTCPCIGVGGHYTHGGFGLCSRAWGLAMDQVVALDVVMANGEVVRASEQENQELFMAMRGAADSFGIAVNFYLQARLAPKTIVKWNVEVPSALASVESAVEALKHVQKFVNDASVVDRRLGLMVSLTRGRFVVGGTFLGRSEEFSAKVLPALLGGLPRRQRVTSSSFQEGRWYSALRPRGNVNVRLEAGINPAEHPKMCYSKCAVVNHPGLSDDVLNRFFDFILSKDQITRPTRYYIGMQLYGGRDSQITANKRNDAFAHRDAMWVIDYNTYIMDARVAVFPEKAVRFVEELHKTLGDGHGAYNNYADASLGFEEAQRLYYGQKLDALKELKGRLDPNDVFCHPQSIKPVGVEDADHVGEGLNK
ncbi:Glucooligosaccharide oxidase [Xylaria sp. CBS 124048]|nr:Glucooligosaccharide oxidase [Xylaria sp. CBS 124048]